MNPIQVSQTNGTATITGTATQADGQVIVQVNGAEAMVSVTNDGFSYTAVLAPGTNTITVRAINCQGVSFSGAQTAVYSPAGGVLFRVTLVWDGQSDIDLHVWQPDDVHVFYVNRTSSVGQLDLDNTAADGPENYTSTVLQPGTYRVGVNAFALRNTARRSGTVRVAIFSGPNAGQVFNYGPYPFTEEDEVYPVTVNSTRWWRPVDIVVSANGTIQVAEPTSVSLSSAVNALVRGDYPPATK